MSQIFHLLNLATLSCQSFHSSPAASNSVPKSTLSIFPVNILITLLCTNAQGRLNYRY